MVDKEKRVIFNLGDSIEATSSEVDLALTDAQRGHLDLAVTYAESFYQTNGGKLAAPEDFKFLRGSLGDEGILKLLKSPEFRSALAKRGIFWPKKYDPDNQKALSVLSPQQQHCVLIVNDPTRNDSLRKRLELVGITYQTYRNWMKQPAFANAINTLAEDVLVDNLASVHTSMTAKAMSGDVSAAKLVYELTGRHDPNKQQMLDLSRIIGLLLESLTRRVTDTTILSQLGKDFDLILAGDMPALEATAADFSFANASEIEDAVIVKDEDTVPEYAVQPAVRDNVTNVPKGFFEI